METGKFSFPVSGQFLVLRRLRVINVLEVIRVFHEVVIDALESRHNLSHGKDLFGSVGPFEITHPGSRVLLGLDVA